MAPDNALCFVQFMHPGSEHRPDRGYLKNWNRKAHRRKFLVSPGVCVQGSEQLQTELVFWGEWEPESEVIVQIEEPLKGGPRYIYRPFYVPPRSYARLQNTDPFVFETFVYGNCQQHTSAGATQLRYLERGSVILFGSCVADAFVLDTVFVVSEYIDHDRNSYASALNGRVPRAYMKVSLNPLYLSGPGEKDGCSPKRGRSYRLYFGATHTSPVNGMFSFFPCLPLDEGRRGFARPVIVGSRFITNHLRQGKRLNRQTTQVQVRELWQSVVEQVLAQDLYLGIQADMPECRGVEG